MVVYEHIYMEFRKMILVYGNKCTSHCYEAYIEVII